MQTRTAIPRPASTIGPFLSSRATLAQAMLRHCEICELRCRVDRTCGESCPCGLSAATHVYKQYLSLNEESELVPAFRVFLGGCNLRCSFCDEAPECLRPEVGSDIDPMAWAAALTTEIDRGARCVSILGGEPTLHVHTLLATAAAMRRPIPIALNSNMYMSPEVLDLLDGVVTTYLADFKYGNDECAHSLAQVPHYTKVVRRNLACAAAGTKVIVRHVLIPGHFACCFRPIVDWLCTEMPGARFQLYTGFVPCWQAADDPKIGRLNTRDEERQAWDYLLNGNLNCGAAPR